MVSVNVGNFITIGLMALFFIFLARWILTKFGVTPPV